MTLPQHGGSAVQLDPRDERARRAVKAFRAMQPTLTAYARVLTRRQNVRVEMHASSNGATDGTRIFFRPPIELGDELNHDRRQCDRRGEDGRLLCEACAVREGVITTIYHEIAHICYDSFAPATDHDKVEATKAAIAEYGTKFAKQIEAAVRRFGPDAPFHAVASVVSPYLHHIVNAMEDARIEQRLFEARPGTRAMFAASNARILAEGVPQPDGTIELWKNYPLNTQATFGLYLKAAGYDFEGYVDPKVYADLADEQLTDYCNRIRTARSASNVYHLAFPVMARLRELGYLKAEQDPEDEEEQPPAEPEKDEDEQDEDSDSGGDDSEDSDDEPGADPADGESEPSSDGGDGDDSDSESGDGEDQVEQDDADSGSDSCDDDGDSGDGAGESSEDEGEQEDGDGGSAPGDGGSGLPAEDESEDQGGEVDAEGQDSSESDSGDAGSGSAPEGHEDGSETDEAGSDASSSEVPDGSSLDEDESESSDSIDDDLDGGEAVQGRSGGGETEGGDAGLGDSDDAPDEASDDREADAGVPGEGRPEVGADPDAPPDDDSIGSGVQPGDGSVTGDESDDDEPIDTGADDGMGGTKILEEDAPPPELNYGTPEDVKAALIKWLDHDEKPDTIEAKADEDSVDKAIVQGIFFERPSSNIFGVREHRYGKPELCDHPQCASDPFSYSDAWSGKTYGWTTDALGLTGDFSTPESILGPALLRMRRAFEDNQRGTEVRHKRSGKVNASVLGKRAHLDDDRLFKRRTLPGKKNYAAIIMMDISGSTIGVNIKIMKAAVMAQAHLLARMGIPFAIYAQSGDAHDHAEGYRGVNGLDLQIYIVKETLEPWDSGVQRRLEELGPDSANLDGHALEYARKKADEARATDKIILFYSDGKMPAENHDEELEILQREIRTCHQKGYTLLGVGIRTDSPSKHGLPTVQLDSVEDIGKVVDQIRERILKTLRR